MTGGRVRPRRSAGAALLAAIALLLAPAAPARAAAGAAGPAAGKDTVASVNGEPVTLEDVRRQIGSLHTGVAETVVRRPDPSALLGRIIDARLVVQEARRIGLDDLPETRSRLDALRLSLTKSALVRGQVGGITEADPAVAERLYRDAVREWIIDSLLFQKEDDATAFSAAIQAGGDFKALAGQAIAAGGARGGAGGQAMKPSELRPEVAKAVAALKPGEVGAPIRLDDGFTIVRLIEVRYPENPEARAESRQEALEIRKQARLDAYMEELGKRYTTVDRRLLATLDFESREPGLEKLRADERIVARVKGGAPVRVRDLTLGVEKKFYHGAQGAAERKRVNEDLPNILDYILMERATVLEAKRLDVERSAAFRGALKDQTEGILFDTFVKKVVDPEVRLDTAGLKTYYDGHRADYAAPEMMRIESLAFRRQEDARSAIEALRKGTDLSWMRAHGTGLVGSKDFASLIELNGALTATPTLPEGMRKALGGARAGDFRFYGEPGGPFYVLAVRQVVASTPQSYESVKADIAAKLFALKRQERVDDWVARLRAASDITIFATGERLSDQLGLGARGGS